MADLNSTLACHAPVKGKFVLQDLLNFSESSDDGHTSPPACNQSAEPETGNHNMKNNTGTTAACSGDKENLIKENLLEGSNSTKKACKKVEAGTVRGKTVSDDINCRVRKSKTILAKGQVVTENVHAGKEKRGVKGTVASAKPKPKPKKSANQQNITLADLGISFDFSESSDEGKPKPAAEKVTGSLHAKKKNGSVKRKVALAAPKAKGRANLQNTTLADLGITIDFSDSSDEEEPKPGAEKERISLIHQERKSSLENRANENRHHTCQPMLPKPKASAPVKDGGKESGDGGPCKSSGQSSSCFANAVPLSSGAHTNTDALVKSAGTAETTSLEKSASKSSTMVLVNAKTFLRKNGGKVESSPNPCASSEHQGPLQHPSMSVIRSAHLPGGLLVDTSPSEESLLPLSESTRLDSGESEAPTKQNFGHLLAYHSSPKLFDSPLGQSKDSSYEQLNIVNQASAPSVTQLDQAKVQFRSSEMESFDEGKQAASLGASESGSLYTTCLSAPDTSSMYEAADMSVQTSFQIDATGSADIERGLEALSLHKSADALHLTGASGRAECGDKADGYQHERSEDETVAREGEDHSNEEVEPHCSSNSRLAFNQDTSVSGDSQSGNIQNADHEPPDLMPGVNFKDFAAKFDLKKARNPSQQAPSERAKDSFESESPLHYHHEQQRTKLPSDSNDFSEGHSGVDSAPDCPDVHYSSKLGASEHAMASSSEDGKKRSSLNEEEKLESDLEEHSEAEKRWRDSPNSFPTLSNSQGWSQAEGNSVSRHRNWTEKVGDSSSSEDDDDKLEAFFQKLRTPARPTKDIADEDGDLDDFIVDDSDIDSDDDECDSSLTWLHNADTLFQSEGVFRRRREDSGLSRCGTAEGTATSSSEEEEEEDRGGVDDEGDRHEGGDGLSTPCAKVRPSFSRSQTPCEASLTWYTPATSMKTKPRWDVDAGKAGRASVLSTKAQSKVDKSGAWATPACLQRTGTEKSARTFSFLRSLSAETPNHLRDPDARSYIFQFKKRQEELSSRLFKLFNFTVFENQLPPELPVVWNKRLLKTAGLCKLKRMGDKHTAAIELSTKVCDTAERLRDTLVHEMCHAAVWVINRAREGHGPHWRYWAGKANRAHPEIPVIRRCHDYKINTKYIYECVKCGYQVGRHSKSLDIETKVCGRCRGRFQLLTQNGRNASAASLPATPRTPNPFAMFVKEHYGSIKKQGGGLPHKEVMEALSKEFAKTKIAFG